MSLITELYYGSINPCAAPPKLSDEEKQLRKKMLESDNRFRSTLSEEQRKQYDAYEILLANYRLICEERSFARAFRLGAQMMLDILTNDED